MNDQLSTEIITDNNIQRSYLKKSTQILFYDGTIHYVEDIKIDDLLMGDDSTPRKVTKVYRGRDIFFKISRKNMEPYYATGNHIVSLRYNTKPQLNHDKKDMRFKVMYADNLINDDLLSTVNVRSVSFPLKKYTEQGALEKAQNLLKKLIKDFDEKYPIHEVKITEYLNQCKSFNHRLTSYKTGVNFSQYHSQGLDPYLLGVWLGDGTSLHPEITNIDQELIDYLYKQSKIMGLILTCNVDELRYRFTSSTHKKGSNSFINFLNINNLINNKHIPHNYKVNSKLNRLSLLAGIIDTDGYYNSKSKSYEIIQKNKILSEDIVFVARSLGFWCHIVPVKKGCMYKGEMKTGLYYRITFGGDGLSELPILISRKIALNNRTPNKNPLHYKFTVTEEQEDDYYGFKLLGENQLFLLSDFTVIHN